MSDNKRIYLSPPHMGGHEMGLVTEAFETNWLSSVGPHVDSFERELANRVGVSGAVALSSGTAAIHIAMRLLGIGAGDKVFCSSLTFIGSVGPVIYQGAEPVFIDSEPASWNMSPTALERAFADAEKSGNLPRAVIVVNIYGQSADMDPLKTICDRHGVPLIEDAAESLGALYKNRASGTFGKFGVFSFNGNKIITTSGGGMLVSGDLEALEKARFLSTQARDPARHYQHSEVGYNYRMSNVLAGIGRGQLRVLDDRIRARRAVFARYQETLSGIEGLAFMPEASFGTATRWLTIMTVNPSVCGVTPLEIMDALAAEDIEARPVWKPMHLQPVFLKCAYYPHDEEKSICDGFFEQGVCLPSGSDMTAEDQDRVIDVLLKRISKRRPHQK